MSCVIKCKNCDEFFSTDDLKPHVCKQYQSMIMQRPERNQTNEEPLKSAFDDVQESPTGSLRMNSGKSQTNEIDPSFILGMGAVLEKSRQKYPRGNWQKGNFYSVPWDSLQRHLLAWQQGEKIDSESGLSHLHHAALNLMMLAHYEENFPEFDDRLFKKGKK
jgi:hypothetical protein